MPGAPAAVHQRRARQSSGTGPCGDCRRVLWVPGPRSQYWRKIRFIEKPGIQDERIDMCLYVVLTPGSLPRSQSSGTGSSAGCGYCCPLCPTGWNRHPGKIRFIEPQMIHGHRKHVAGAPSSGTPRESQAKLRVGTVWGL